jgi:hypothetical protein
LADALVEYRHGRISRETAAEESRAGASRMLAPHGPQLRSLYPQLAPPALVARHAAPLALAGLGAVAAGTGCTGLLDIDHDYDFGAGGHGGGGAATTTSSSGGSGHGSGGSGHGVRVQDGLLWHPKLRSARLPAELRHRPGLHQHRQLRLRRPRFFLGNQLFELEALTAGTKRRASLRSRSAADWKPRASLGGTHAARPRTPTAAPTPGTMPNDMGDLEACTAMCTASRPDPGHASPLPLVRMPVAGPSQGVAGEECAQLRHGRRHALLLGVE